MKHVLIFLLLSISLICKGQTYNNVWTFDNSRFSDLVIDHNGNIYLSGQVFGDFDADPGPGYFDLNGSNDGSNFLIKLDSNSNFIYAKKFPWSQGSPNIQVDALGNLYLTGIFGYTADFNPSASLFMMSPTGNVDGYIVKLNSSGDFQWAKKLGATGLDYFIDLMVDSDGSIVLTGQVVGSVTIPTTPASSFSSGSNVQNTFIFKMDPSGNYISAQRIGSSNNSGSALFCADSQDNLLICSSFAATWNFDSSTNAPAIPSTEATFFAKFTDTGSVEWLKHFGGNTLPKEIIYDNESNILFATYITEPTDLDPSSNSVIISDGTFPKAVLSKYSPFGDHIWSKELPLGDQFNYFFYDTYAINIAVDEHNDIHLASYFYVTSVFEINGQTDTVTTNVSPDIYYVKLNQDGDIQWKKIYGDVTPNQIYNVGCRPSGILITDDNQIYIAGDFSGTVDFDAGSQTDIRTTIASDTYSFLMRLDILDLNADFNLDGQIDGQDLNNLSDYFGCTTCPEFDLSQDGIVNVQDILILIDLLN